MISNDGFMGLGLGRVEQRQGKQQERSLSLQNVEYVGVCGGDVLFVSFIINGVGIEADIDGFGKESFFVVFFCGENGKVVKIKGVSVSKSVFRKRGLDFTFSYVGYIQFDQNPFFVIVHSPEDGLKFRPKRWQIKIFTPTLSTYFIPKTKT